MWSSKAQILVALPSSAAEFIAAAKTVKEILFVVQLLNRIGAQGEFPVAVYVDNQGAIYIAQQDTWSGRRTTQMDTRIKFVNGLVEEKLVELQYMRPKTMSHMGFLRMLTKTCTKHINPGWLQRRATSKLELTAQLEGCQRV